MPYMDPMGMVARTCSVGTLRKLDSIINCYFP